MDEQIDDIEELKRWIAVVVQNSAKADSERLQIAANTLLTGTDQLVSVLASRNAALAKQCRPRNATPPKAAPARGPQKANGDDSSADTPNAPKGAEGRSEELAQIQQGIDQVIKGQPSVKSQQQLLRQQSSGMTPDEKAFRQNANLNAETMPSMKSLMNCHNTVFIMTTNNLSKVDRGIISRSHIVFFGAASSAKWLPKVKQVLMDHGVTLPSDAALTQMIDVRKGDARGIINDAIYLANQRKANGHIYCPAIAAHLLSKSRGKQSKDAA